MNNQENIKKITGKIMDITIISSFVYLIFKFVSILKMKSWVMGVDDYSRLGILLISTHYVIIILTYKKKERIKKCLYFIGEIVGFIGFLMLSFTFIVFSLS